MFNSHYLSQEVLTNEWINLSSIIFGMKRNTCTPWGCEACSSVSQGITAFRETVFEGHDERMADLLGALRWKKCWRVTGLKMEPRKDTLNFGVIVTVLPTKLDWPQGQPQIRNNNKNYLFDNMTSLYKNGKTFNIIALRTWKIKPVCQMTAWHLDKPHTWNFVSTHTGICAGTSMCIIKKFNINIFLLE